MSIEFGRAVGPCREREVKDVKGRSWVGGSDLGRSSPTYTVKKVRKLRKDWAYCGPGPFQADMQFFLFFGFINLWVEW